MRMLLKLANTALAATEKEKRELNVYARSCEYTIANLKKEISELRKELQEVRNVADSVLTDKLVETTDTSKKLVIMEYSTFLLGIKGLTTLIVDNEVANDIKQLAEELISRHKEKTLFNKIEQHYFSPEFLESKIVLYVPVAVG